MWISRRELLCSQPILGLPAAMEARPKGAPPEDESLPSAGYSFDKLPVHTPKTTKSAR